MHGGYGGESLTNSCEQGIGLAGRLSGGSIQIALWLIVALLAINAAVMLVQPGNPAHAQPAGQPAIGRSDTSGVYVVPAQIDNDQWGAYLVDGRAGTIVLYQYHPSARKLRLVAARTFVYDRYLEDYNTDPSPSDIADLLTRAKRVGPRQPEPSDQKN